ncbi:DUF1640 domain-containing protein [Neomoorella mulderi]
MPEEIRQEIERGKREVAAGAEEKAVDFGFYLLVDRIADLKSDLQKQIMDVKESLRQEMKQEIGALRQEVKQQTDALRQEMKQETGSLRQEMESLRREIKQDYQYFDNKLDNYRWWSIGTFFAVLVGSLAIAFTIYFAR